MVSTNASSLRDALDQKLTELAEALEGLDEEAAARRHMEGEWCCKEVLSHLLGEEGQEPTALYERILEEDTPLIPVVTGLPYYTPGRQAMPLSELRGAVESRYKALGEFLAELSDEQLARKARVPLFKDTPIGEYPTLAQVAGGLINFHLTDHVNQIREARRRAGG